MARGAGNIQNTRTPGPLFT